MAMSIIIPAVNARIILKRKGEMKFFKNIQAKIAPNNSEKPAINV